VPASPPELPDEEPPLEEDELPPEEELPPDDELPDDELPPDDEPPDDEPPDDEPPTVASLAPESGPTDASGGPPRPGRQYCPPRGDIAQMSPAGQSALLAQS